MQIEYKRIDLHIHSTVSDGTDTPREILQKVREAGIEAFSVTDHDAVKANGVIRSILEPGDPLFIPGVEFSCKDDFGKCHILGYGADPDAPEFAALLQHGHELRMEKVTARLDFIRSEFGFTFPQEEIEKLLLLDNPGKPHIANLMVRYGYADTKENAFKHYLDRLSFQNRNVTPEETIPSIIAAGGVPVLAHPFYGSGDELIIGEEMEKRLCRLKEFGLQGIEVFYSGFTDKLRAAALALAESFDLFVTAGSDYHGKNKMVRLGDTGLTGAKAIPPGLIRFFERFMA